jgi:glycosyltransferase involved in cell wall biosynthesis
LNKISVILPDLRVGGAERVAINLANHWTSLGLNVEFVLMHKQGEFISSVNPSIAIYDLQSPRIRHAPRRLLSYFRQRRPDVTVAHMWPLTSATVLAWRLCGCPGKLFLCEHVSLSDHVCRDLSTPLALAKATLRSLHPMATGIVAVSKGVASDLAHLASLSAQSIRVIYNPVVHGQTRPREPVNNLLRRQLWQGDFTYTIISIGTLKPQKNHLLLLEAFARLPPELDAGLVILGDGPLRPALQQKIRELGLERRVRLPGFNPNPDHWLRAADLFVLSSDFEGFANVLAESLAAGTPIVSTDCNSGPAEILENGRYGTLVPIGDAASLARAIQHSLMKVHDSNDLIKRAEEFSVTKISSQYLSYFRSID